MQEQSGVLVGMCALLLLSSAGVLYLLVQQRQLVEELLRLDAQVQALSRSCRPQAGEQPPAEAGEPRSLHRSRRHQEGPAAPRQDGKDVMMLMTYSMVPVRHPNA